MNAGFTILFLLFLTGMIAYVIWRDDVLSKFLASFWQVTSKLKGGETIESS